MGSLERTRVQECAVGATWNSSVARAMGEVLAWESRALWLNGGRELSTWSGQAVIGLNMWSPTINVPHDPRWGRSQEVPAEDPLLLGDYGAAYTVGAATGGHDPRYLSTVPTIKHWVAYSLEDSDGFTRYDFNAIISPYEVALTYFPGFEYSVRAGNAQGVMCSYNALNGVPTCASDFLRETLRDEWGFVGYQTSDTDAVQNIWQPHNYSASWTEAICVALVDGQTDVNSVNGGPGYWSLLAQALTNGTVGNCSRSALQGAVQAAIENTFGLRIALGEFDPPSSTPLWSVPLSAIGNASAQLISQQVTDQGIVLLQNDGTLPLTPGKLTLAAIGPHAMSQMDLLGADLGQVCPGWNSNNVTCVEPPLAAVTSLNAPATVTYSQGCAISGNDTSGFAAAIATAKAADAVLLFLGIDQTLEGEENDRTSIDLPLIQHQLAQAIRAAVGPSKPIVVTLVHGGPVSVAEEMALANAILDASYPGVYGAQAIGKALFGQLNPGGKVTQTVYPANLTSQVLMSNMSLLAPPGRTYRYYTGTPLFPFGWGLSYSTFRLSLTAPAPIRIQSATLSAAQWTSKWSVEKGLLGSGVSSEDARNQVAPSIGLPAGTITVNVLNTAGPDGDEVVQVYWVMSGSGSGSGASGTPDEVVGDVPQQKRLIAYRRVHVPAGTTQQVSFTLSALDVTDVDASGNRVSLPGSYNIAVSNGATQLIANAATITVQGSAQVIEPLRLDAWNRDAQKAAAAAARRRA
jgi:beta-D-xylosidase 4